jgi:hypothetical protein
MTFRIACLGAALIGGSALAQPNDRIEALGTFDQIALECARGGSDADIDAFRIKLWRAYLTSSGGDPGASDDDIKDTIDKLRQQLSGEDVPGLRRQYTAARAAIPQAKSLSEAQEKEFYKLCESPKVQGLPDQK